MYFDIIWQSLRIKVSTLDRYEQNNFIYGCFPMCQIPIQSNARMYVDRYFVSTG